MEDSQFCGNTRTNLKSKPEKLMNLNISRDKSGVSVLGVRVAERATKMEKSQFCGF